MFLAEICLSMWYLAAHILRHGNVMMTPSNGAFSALLALCAGKSPITGEIPAQRPVTRSFDVLFDLRLNIRLSKQWRGWWFETPSRSLWRQCSGSTATVRYDDQNLFGFSGELDIRRTWYPMTVLRHHACCKCPGSNKDQNFSSHRANRQ